MRYFLSSVWENRDYYSFGVLCEVDFMSCMKEKVDVCVIGAGHAGCEAALACARLGLETVIFTVSIDSVALMP